MHISLEWLPRCGARVFDGWAVISFLETLDVVLTRSRKTCDQTLGGLILDRVLQVHQLFFLGNGRSIVNLNTELLPEVFPP